MVEAHPNRVIALGDDGIRPAGRSDACFYCQARIGQKHAEGCVMVTRLVKVTDFRADRNDILAGWYYDLKAAIMEGAKR